MTKEDQVSDHELAAKFSSRCPICRMPAFIGLSENPSDPVGSLFPISCSRCGSFRSSHHANAAHHWTSLSQRQVANISGYLRENGNSTVADDTDIAFLKQLSTPSVAERARKLLASLARRYPIPGTEINPHILHLDRVINELSTSRSYGTSSWGEKQIAAALERLPLLSYAWAQDETELRFLLFDFLCDAVGLVQGRPEEIQLVGYLAATVKISAAGWEHLQNFGLSDSNTGFVAMWFDPSLELAWKLAFQPAVSGAGYAPLRIDKREHNNKIDDEIIASIRGARFVIADFTGSRGGVYYEAGFASGLDKPVIWTVREDWLNQLHFDTRQFNHITWRVDALDDLRIALKNRIEGTIGKGPLRPPSHQVSIPETSM